MSVGVPTNEDVFTPQGYLTTPWHVFLGVKTMLHSIEPPPFVQPMYVKGIMVKPWVNFFQNTGQRLAIGRPPAEVKFMDENNKIAKEWLPWLQQW